jgi:hypothetical protein
MNLVLDMVDLLQLHELWGRRPIITAYTRLEQRHTALACAMDFNVDGLLPRLTRLKNSPEWRSNRANLTNDPARIPLGNLSEDYLGILYPEAETPASARQALFMSAYNRFVVIRYSCDETRLCGLLSTLSKVRNLPFGDFLDASRLPRPGAAEWIPAEITDEIRGLDERYEAAEPGTPATYVVSDDFWTTLVKTGEGEIDQTATLFSKADAAPSIEACRQQLAGLVEVAQVWNRSPSVVGLCYQVGRGEVKN